MNRVFRLSSLVAILALALSMTACDTTSPAEELTEVPTEEPAEDPTEEPTEEPAEEPKTMTYSAPPEMQIDTTKTYVATFDTEKGTLVCELFAADAPVTVNSFVFLAQEGYYDGVTFHRVIPGFMAQGGDPTGTGGGGPGYKFEDEFSSRKHGTGALSMANAGPGTNGSQFFITYEPQPHLDGKHSVFGQLTEGMDVLKKLENGDVIKTMTITES